mmetsp:Transcript_11171/g.20658  ORF Transcript_11171/g.20658 Transcript_11171/m.20658 type:complete len:284 (-) Transcript_11171:915-1766(-)
MSSTSTIPPSHASEWPALSQNQQVNSEDNHVVDNDWELLPEPTTTPTTTTPTVRIVEPEDSTTEDKPAMKKINPRILKHCQSSPDLRQYVLEQSDDEVSSSSSDEEASSAVIIDNGDLSSLASSSVVMVPSGTSGTPASSSPWASNKISFRDAILKKQPEEAVSSSAAKHNHHHHHHHPTRIRKLKKPKFLVVKPIQRCARSTGDLKSLGQELNRNDDEDNHGVENILGETDGEQFYHQKSKGQLGRKNGRKTRPDEAKRLEITMAKKSMQREKQQQGGAKRH